MTVDVPPKLRYYIKGLIYCNLVFSTYFLRKSSVRRTDGDVFELVSAVFSGLQQLEELFLTIRSWEAKFSPNPLKKVRVPTKCTLLTILEPCVSV